MTLTRVDVGGVRGTSALLIFPVESELNPAKDELEKAELAAVDVGPKLLVVFTLTKVVFSYDVLSAEVLADDLASMKDVLPVIVEVTAAKERLAEDVISAEELASDELVEATAAKEGLAEDVVSADELASDELVVDDESVLYVLDIVQ